MMKMEYDVKTNEKINQNARNERNMMCITGMYYCKKDYSKMNRAGNLASNMSSFKFCQNLNADAANSYANAA